MLWNGHWVQEAGDGQTWMENFERECVLNWHGGGKKTVLFDPAKFSKSLKSIENYIQKTYKMPDDIVKAIQQMKRPTLDYPWGSSAPQIWESLMKS